MFTFQASSDYFPPRISIKWKFLAKVREMLPNQFLMLFTVQNLKSLTKVKAEEYPDFIAIFVCLFVSLSLYFKTIAGKDHSYHFGCIMPACYAEY